MKIHDKNNVLGNIQNNGNFILELGCGNRKRIENSIGIDIIDYDNVDIVGDVFDVLNEIPNGSIDVVYSHSFFEHIDDLKKLMTELARVVKTDGHLEITVPHFSNPYFYSDYTHRAFFGLYTFCYFCEQNLFRRVVPTYEHEINFELEDVKLIFKSPPPFYLRYGIKKILQFIFNMSRYMQEFYEENCSYIFPCYDIKYFMRRKV